MSQGHPQYPMVNHMGQILMIGFVFLFAGGLLTLFLQWVYNRFIRRTPPPEYTEKPKFFERD
ncbi:MAG: hypothetical protein M1537_09265 [Nitrospirae bacterium]|nr:MAG: hypothetical protein D084_Lepto4C00157G0002 [Leptospirillum sp. Group IV 'UBA BS']MCL4486493.1 hypothetical protein [Nitrospirota bacterium]MCL5284273.1 hypothetical protein [Nitrospirota bacterium]